MIGESGIVLSRSHCPDIGVARDMKKEFDAVDLKTIPGIEVIQRSEGNPISFCF